MEHAEIFAKLWPNGMPPEERAEWSSVPNGRRDRVLQRLSALAALEADEVNVGTAADLAGLSRQAFHKLRDRWKRERSIRSLTPYRSRKQASSQLVTTGDSDIVQSTDPLLAAAVDLVSSLPSKTNGGLGRRLRDSLGQSISQPTAVELVRQARRLAALDPDLLKETYGRALLIDFVGLQIDRIAIENDPVPIAAIVLERASGTILGFAVGERSEMRDLQIDSIRDAIETLSRHEIDITAQQPVGCRIILPDPEPKEGDEFLLERLHDLLNSRQVFAKGMRRFGVRTTSVIGRKICRVRLSSRIGEGETGRAFKPFIREPKGPKLPLPQFALLARSEIVRYNEPLLARVRGLPAQTTLAKKGSMASTLQSILEILQTH